MKNPSPEIVCEQCGDVGFHELLVICSRCIGTQRHIYCMYKTPHYIPEKWYCDDCLAETILVHRKAISSNDRRIETPIKETFWQKSLKGLPRRPAKKMMLGTIYSRTLKAETLKNTEVNFIPAEEVGLLNPRKLVRLSSTVISSFSSQTSEEIRKDDPSCGRVNDKGKQGLRAQNTEENKQGGEFLIRNSSSSPSSSGKTTQPVPRGPAALPTTKCEALKKAKGSGTRAYARNKRKNVHLPSQLLVVLDEEHQSQPSPRSLWKGGFEISDGAAEKCYEVHGHLPGKLHLIAFQAVEKLPKKLKFKLLPRRNVWPKVFQLDRPTDQDVGLFFFPGDGGRSKEKYVKLLERIDKDDLAMQSSLGNFDLVVYTSSQLPQDSEVAATMGPFFWGLVWKIKNKGHNNSNGPAGGREAVNRKVAADLRNKSEITPATPPATEKLVNLEKGANALHQPSSSPSAGFSPKRPSDKGNGLESPQTLPWFTIRKFTASQPLSSPGRVRFFDPKYQEDKAAFPSFPTRFHQHSNSSTPRRRRCSPKRPNVRETRDKSNEQRSPRAAQSFNCSEPFSSPGGVQTSITAASPVITPSLNKPSNSYGSTNLSPKEPNVCGPGDKDHNRQLVHGVKEEFPSVPPGFKQLPTRPHHNANENSDEANGRRSLHPFSIPGSEQPSSGNSNMQISPQTTPRFDSSQSSVLPTAPRFNGSQPSSPAMQAARPAFYSAPRPSTCEQFAQSSPLQYSDAFIYHARQQVALYGRQPGARPDGPFWSDQVARYGQHTGAGTSRDSHPCWPPNCRYR